jgi:hypothetical protein
VTLDEIAVDLHNQIESTETVSFVIKDKRPNVRVQLRFDIVRHIIDVKLADQEKAANALAVKQERERILEILADKEDDETKALSADELRAKLEALEE